MTRGPLGKPGLWYPSTYYGGAATSGPQVIAGWPRLSGVQVWIKKYSLQKILELDYEKTKVVPWVGWIFSIMLYSLPQARSGVYNTCLSMRQAGPVLCICITVGNTNGSPAGEGHRCNSSPPAHPAVVIRSERLCLFSYSVLVLVGFHIT